ncbi:LacI family DNA-binding transcriptional regulator [Microvirga rosea]|uniref:LacI family DNA-binding transcriptional regulator n=1 Tax=Microvirga rosea TaxID=2715425 RepID=UPI001D0AAEEE|nr:LacI family DNA-binding transcriptional regulator [Microvirga rosea]MCB8823506.1 LacI family DNA-binding transcriptional regulator [Microvirga rosea]
MTKSFVTAKEVAALAKVSRSTVSRTFTEGASVAPDVRQRVEEAAKALGYRVNKLAQNLSADQSQIVGVVGSNLSTPFAARQLDQLSRGLLQRGMQCLLLNAADAQHDISPLIEQVLEFRVRAIVIMSGAPPGAIIDECLANGVRVIVVNRQTDVETDTILSDDVAGVRQAAERLIMAGCRFPAVVSSSARTQSQARRRNEFLKLMFEAGLEPAIWAQGVMSYETGQLAARDLLATETVDGVFCVTDLLALGFLDAARDMGRRVPEEVSVIGFDDIPQANWSAYQLTTIRQPLDELTDAVLAAIDRDVRGGNSRPIRRILPATLIERATVRAPTTV